MLAQLNGHCIKQKVIANHIKRSRGQNCYQVVTTPGWKQQNWTGLLPSDENKIWTSGHDSRVNSPAANERAN